MRLSVLVFAVILAGCSEPAAPPEKPTLVLCYDSGSIGFSGLGPCQRPVVH